jgi:hypothetical protein
VDVPISSQSNTVVTWVLNITTVKNSIKRFKNIHEHEEKY